MTKKLHLSNIIRVPDAVVNISQILMHLFLSTPWGGEVRGGKRREGEGRGEKGNTPNIKYSKAHILKHRTLLLMKKQTNKCFRVYDLTHMCVYFDKNIQDEVSTVVLSRSGDSLTPIMYYQ